MFAPNQSTDADVQPLNAEGNPYIEIGDRQIKVPNDPVSIILIYFMTCNEC